MTAWAVFDKDDKIRSIATSPEGAWERVESALLEGWARLKKQGYTCHQVEITKKPVGE